MEYDGVPAFTPGSNEVATVEYVDNIAISGSPDATDTTKGISKLSVAAASPSNPISVGDNDNRVSPVSLATVTGDIVDALAGTGTPSAAAPYVTNDDTSDDGTASKVVRYDASSQIDVAATPTDATHAASKGWVETEASKKVSVSTTTTSVINTAAEEDLISFSIPGGTLGTNDVVKLKADLHIDINNNSATALVFRLKYGSTTIATINGATGSASTFDFDGTLEAFIAGDGATGAQVGKFGWTLIEDSSKTLIPNNDADAYTTLALARGTAAEDSTGNLDFKITVQPVSANAGLGATVYSYVAYKID